MIGKFSKICLTNFPEHPASGYLLQKINPKVIAYDSEDISRDAPGKAILDDCFGKPITFVTKIDHLQEVKDEAIKNEIGHHDNGYSNHMVAPAHDWQFSRDGMLGRPPAQDEGYAEHKSNEFMSLVHGASSLLVSLLSPLYGNFFIRSMMILLKNA